MKFIHCSSWENVHVLQVMSFILPALKTYFDQNDHMHQTELIGQMIVKRLGPWVQGLHTCSFLVVCSTRRGGTQVSFYLNNHTIDFFYIKAMRQQK